MAKEKKGNSFGSFFEQLNNLLALFLRTETQPCLRMHFLCSYSSLYPYNRKSKNTFETLVNILSITKCGVNGFDCRCMTLNLHQQYAMVI
jgi:hypothetical protein